MSTKSKFFMKICQFVYKKSLVQSRVKNQWQKGLPLETKTLIIGKINKAITMRFFVENGKP